MCLVWLPWMRCRRVGCIALRSSLSKVRPYAYSCFGGFKLTGLGVSESLAVEVEPYNVRVLLVQPGAFRTNFLGAYKMTSSLSLKEYPAANSVIEKFKAWPGKQPGDAEKAATRIVEAVSGKGLAGGVMAEAKGKVVRLPLGPDCVRRFEGKLNALKGNLEVGREAAMSTDVDE
jgi:NAD(P)-dependent dehydrogenase (short-subunit alcohol dehydrogenase family)